MSNFECAGGTTSAPNNACVWDPPEARRVCRAVYLSTLAATLQREHQARLDRLFRSDAEASLPLRERQGSRYLHYQARLLARLTEARSLTLRPNPSRSPPPRQQAYQQWQAIALATPHRTQDHRPCVEEGQADLQAGSR